MTVKPHAYIRDEALRAIYSNTQIDFSGWSARYRRAAEKP
jgi:hypothetical protein